MYSRRTDPNQIQVKTRSSTNYQPNIRLSHGPITLLEIQHEFREKKFLLEPSVILYRESLCVSGVLFTGDYKRITFSVWTPNYNCQNFLSYFLFNSSRMLITMQSFLDIHILLKTISKRNLREILFDLLRWHYGIDIFVTGNLVYKIYVILFLWVLKKTNSFFSSKIRPSPKFFIWSPVKPVI